MQVEEAAARGSGIAKKEKRQTCSTGTIAYDARILVVDDEASNIRLMKKTLGGHGYQNVCVTQDPREVIGLCSERQFDLLILDLDMPHLNGFQVMKQLSSELSSIRPAILVLTAQHSRDHRIQALEMGARDFVSKPFDRLELLARVRNLIDVQLAQQAMFDQKEILEIKVRERTRELHQTRLQAVQRLGRAAEYRDNETGLHIIRMSYISALLGKTVGMSDVESDLLLNASPMHDVGKIGVPDKILLKPGKLSEDEWEVMKTHVQIGADILSGSESALMTMAYDIALTHHEKWDGSGYPNALEGEQIPLTGRIVALADVFDALTSERPYKAAWPVESAVDYIKDQSGKHFDPVLVHAFLSVLPDIISIHEEYAEPESVT
jgi:putative two-component system response regulator